MPRLGGTQSASNGSLHDQLSKKLTFFGLVGIVMAALSFKERWDACGWYSIREVPALILLFHPRPRSLFGFGQ